MTRRRSGGFARADGLDLALRAVAEEGPAGVTIGSLCRRAGKTRGSFCARFPAVGDFAHALAERWRTTATEVLIDAVAHRRTAESRRGPLNALALGLDSRLEQGMRRLAAVEDAVARIACAALVGLQQTEPDTTREDLELRHAVFLRRMGLA